MADLVCARYRQLNVATEVIEAEPNRTNVVATWPGSDPTGPKLLVNCHLDTHDAHVSEWVDPFTGEVRTEWTADPFSGEIIDGRIYGRGAADHKSPIAAMLMAFEALKAHDVKLKGTVTCIHDADEETGGRLGMQMLQERLPFDFDMALYACTSEFTPLGREFFPAMGTDNIIRTFAGWQTYKVTFSGQNLHNLTPKRGYGAVEAALSFLKRLEPLVEEVNRYVDPVEGSGQPPMRISGITCEPRAAFHHQARWCEVAINRRIPPSVDPGAARSAMQKLVDEHNRAYPNNTATLELVRDLRPAITAEDHPLVTGLATAIKQAVGSKPTVAGMPSPVGISALLAHRDIPTVLFGYGLVNLHHAIDEHIACDALVKTAKVYAVALMEWLGVAEAEGR